MDLTRFSKQVFENAAATEVKELCQELASRVSAELSKAAGDEAKMHRVTSAVIPRLCLLGHDLCLFDEDGEGMQAWCPDWSGGGDKKLPGLFVTVDRLDHCEVSWNTSEGESFSAKAGTLEDD